MDYSYRSAGLDTPELQLGKGQTIHKNEENQKKIKTLEVTGSAMERSKTRKTGLLFLYQ